jgi:hypothetical protein
MNKYTISDAISFVARLVFAAFLLVPSLAHAQSSETNRPAAQALFSEGMGLMEAGKFAEACPKLEASKHLVAGIGTQFNLADCYEKTGRLASAWANFRSAADAAAKKGETEREAVARQRADALVPRLAYVTVNVSQPTVGLVIKFDNSEVPQGAWGTALPTDSGVHQIEVTAPGKEPWTMTVTLNQEAAKAVVAVPLLKDTTVQSLRTGSVVPNNLAQPRSGASQKTWAFIAGGIGVLGIGVGSAMALSAKHLASSADCKPDNTCSPAGLHDRTTAIHRANWSMLPMGIGLVGLGTGIGLWLTRPTSKGSERPIAGLWLSANEFLISGRF